MRYPGSPGNLAMEEKIAQRFAATGLEHGALRFPVPVFRPGVTTLTLDGQAPIPLRVLHPTLFRPGNFKEKEFGARLVYLGRGTAEDLDRIKGTDLDGAIALMEFDCGPAWLEVLRFGVRGFVFIAREPMERFDALSKVYASEVAVPRFLVEAAPGDALKAAAATAPTVRLRAEPSRWENQVLRDLWVLIPGRDPDLSKEICVITAPLDANCVAPELATGAQAGANLFLLLRLLERFQAAPPARSVLCVAVNAHTQNFRGERLLAWHLLAPNFEQVRDTLNADRRLQRLLVGYYGKLILREFQHTPDDLRALPSVLNQVAEEDGLTVKAVLCARLKTELQEPHTQERETRQALWDALTSADTAAWTPETIRLLNRYLCQIDEDRLIEWRKLIDDSIGKNITIKDAVVSLAKRDVNRTKTEQIELLRQGLPQEEYARRRAALESERVRYVHVLTLFNKVGLRTKLSELTEDERTILRGYVDEIVTFNQTCADLNERDLALDKQNGAIRDLLKGRRVPFALCLDLDWASSQIGFTSLNADGQKRWGVRWGGHAARLAAELEARQGGDAPPVFVDAMAMRGGLTERHYFGLGNNKIVQKSPVLCFHGANQTPAFALKNAFTEFGRAFLPSDTFARLDRAVLARQLAYVPALFAALLDDPLLTTSTELGAADSVNTLGSTQVKTFKFDELAASVFPEIPVANSAVILRPVNMSASAQPLADDAIAAGDVVNADIALTDRRAAVMLYGLYEDGVSAAFHFDADWTEVDHAIDAGEAHAKISAGSTGYARGAPATMLALFECREFPLYATADASLIAAAPITVTKIYPLTAKGNTAPKKCGAIGVANAFSKKGFNATAGAPAAFYFHHRENVKLITADKRLALNATEQECEGVGFAPDVRSDRDLFAGIAADMSVLNHARERKLKDVANALVHEFLQRGDRALARMRTALAGRDYGAYLRALYEALGAQVKSYDQAKQTSDDMLKAVVVYMALLLPFCFFVQKLLFKFVRIEHEMGMFAVLFVLTFIVFRLIHPAFRVAQAAEAIFIAFVMGALGLFVIGILRGRFEGEMQLLFRNYLGGAGGEVGYSTVTQKALLIGVNNMKRRRIRTMLTTATIVLVAFTMLSFTSISKKVNPTLVARGKNAPYTGFMYHWPGKATMDEATLSALRALCAGRADQIVVRRWLAPPDNAPLHVTASTGQEGRFEALLGLPVAEDGFLGPMPLIGGRFFSADTAEETLVSAAAAAILGLDPNRLEDATLRCLGRTLRVVGVFDDGRFRDLKDLNGVSLLPIKRVAKDTGLAEAFSAQSGAGAGDASEEAGLQFFTDPGAVLLAPAGLAEKLGAQPYSVSVKLKPDAPIWPLADLLLTVTGAKFYLSSLFPFAFNADEAAAGDETARKAAAAGIYYVGSNYTTSIGGLSVLLIPLFIAGTIILNTMLGSVYERKKEIAVYNAVGLNPHHIGMFFLAESFVYGVIGAVGGYLIGQVLSLVINQTGWVTGINLNYSSLSVAYVILFTIGIVLLSTLYPAMVATKAAVPSGKRKWALPAHDGNTMRVLFPFIYQPHLAAGVIAYLQEYFGRFTEASIGDLIATPERQARAQDPQGRPRFTLEYYTALAPFDLGVTQRLVFDLAYEEQVQAYRLDLHVRRISGQDSNWGTTNQPFLERLRKYLMRWRNLDVATQELYVRRAQTEFEREEGKTVGV